MKFRSVKYLTVEGFKNIWVNRLMTIASIVVLVACMVLIGAAALFSINADRALGTLQDQNVVLVYLDDAATEAEAQTAFMKIKAVQNVKDAVFIDKEDGMQSLIDRMGEQYADLFTSLGNEYLPYGVQVSFVDLEQYDQTIVAIKAVNHVSEINDARKLTMQIVGIRKIVTIAGTWMIALLLVTALVIIANTIRITMSSRKLEISIMKAVGATNNFVRFPFIVEGMVFGIISALISIGLLYFAYKMTLTKLTEIVSLSAVPFSSVAWMLFAVFCALGIVAGTLGSIFSIQQYLRKEGSELSAF